MRCCSGAKQLDESINAEGLHPAHLALFSVADQRAAELVQTIRRILERRQNGVTLFRSQCDESDAAADRVDCLDGVRRAVGDKGGNERLRVLAIE